MKKGLLLILAFALVFGINAQTTIYDVQYTTVAGDGTYPSLEVGNVVTVSGIVTAVTGYSYYIQDGAGGWNGIYVYDDTNSPAIGDDVTVTALVEEYYGLTELKTVTGFTTNSSGNPLPNYDIVSSGDVNDEQNEGVLIAVENAECTAAPDGYGQWYVNNDLQIDDSMYDSGIFTPVLGTHYDIIGVVDYSYDEFGLHPRSLDDINESASIGLLSKNLKLFPNPAKSVLNINSISKINNITVSNVIGQRIINISNVDSKNFSLEVESLANGVYLINIENIDGISSITKFVKE